SRSIRPGSTRASGPSRSPIATVRRSPRWRRSTIPRCCVLKGDMPDRTRDVAPGPDPRRVRTREGQLLEIPADWELLPPGDPGLTRRVKAAGPSWTVKEQRGRKLFSRGVWAPREHIEAARAQLEIERARPEYERKLEA